MNRLLSLAVTLLLSASVAFAADTPVVPKSPVTGSPGQFVKFDAVSPTPVKFKVLNDAAKLTIVPQGELANGNRFLAIGQPGSYKIAVWTGDSSGPSDLAIVDLVIGDTPAPVTPVDPPAPVEPDDVLYKAIKTVYTSTDKSLVTKLSKSYTETATALTDKTKVKTVGDVFTTATVKRAANGVGDTDIKPLRKVCNDSVGNLLGKDPEADLTDDLRNKVAKQFTLLSTYLDKLVK